jgi:iron complex outermembrane receptor protein
MLDAKNRTVLLAAAGAALALTAQASAQSTQASQAPTDTSSGLEMVLVTAQKRTESVQSVPVTLDVVPSEQLARQNIVKLEDLTRAAPSLQLNSQTGGGFQIRGVGTYGFARSAESAVGAVVDGVVMPTIAGTALSNSMYDLERVEVLAGPQGTLFGKNASAGLVNIVTKAPQYGVLDATFHADAGSTHDVVNAQAIVNIPLGDNAAVRLSYHHNRVDDIYVNAFTNTGDINAEDGGRMRLRWTPTENLTVNLAADYNYIRENGVNWFVGPEQYVDPSSPLYALLQSCGVTPGPRNNRTCSDTATDGQANYRFHNGGESLQLDYDLNGYGLTSITAARQYQQGDFDLNSLGGDTDSVPLPLFPRNMTPIRRRTVSEELRLASPVADRFLSYVAGLYYNDTVGKDKVDQEIGIPLGGDQYLGLRRGVLVRNDSSNYALFAQGDLHFTDKLTGIIGARYTHDHVFDRSEALTFPQPGPPFLGDLYLPSFSFQLVDNTIAKNNVSWKLGARYQIERDLMAYVTAAHGYKAGFVNDQSTPLAPSLIVVRPEFPMDYELGLKSTLFSKLAFDVALFHTRITDFQTPIFLPPTCTGAGVPPGCNPVGTFVQGNAPYMISEGVDVSFFGNPVAGLQLNGGVVYDRAHFAPGFTVPCPVSPAAPCETLGADGTRSAGHTSAVSQLPSTPKWKFTFSSEYAHAMGTRLEGYLQGDVLYTSTYSYSVAYDPIAQSGNRVVTGARVGVRSSRGTWGVGVYCRNCFDRRYPSLIAGDPLSTSNGGNGLSYIHSFNLDSYRTVGLSVDAHY